MGLMIRSSSIHAAGCYTTSPITKGVKVVEYTGPRITKQEADVRFRNSPTTYLFGIGDGSTVIDGHGTAMYINHSCDPNCETEELDGRVWVMSLRAIKPGEELTYDYNLYDGDEDDARCHCGARNCRQTMYSPEEIARQKKAVKQKAQQAAEDKSRRATAVTLAKTPVKKGVKAGPRSRAVSR
jgi:SET domain-containing protein